MIKALLIFSFLFFIWSCSNNGPQIIFESNTPSEIYLHDLNIYKPNANIYSKSLTDCIEFYGDDIRKKNVRHTTTIDYINLKTIFPENSNDSISYILSTEINNLYSGEVFLLIGCTGNISVQLDKISKKIDADYNTYKKFNKYISLGNFIGEKDLSIKVDFTESIKNQKITIALAKKTLAQKLHYKSFSNAFLANSIIEQEDSLFLKTAFDIYKSSKYRIVKNNEIIFESELDSKSLTIPKQFMNSGVYSCEIFNETGRKYQQAFVVGNSDSIYRKLSENLRYTMPKEDYFKKVEACNSRYNYLTKYPRDTGQRIAKFYFSFLTESKKWIHSQKITSRSITLKQGNHCIGKQCDRYLKIIGLGNNFHSWNNLCEIKIFGKKDSLEEESADIVVQDIISSSYEGRHYPANAIDNNISTSWQSANEGEWLMLDLRSDYFIDSIQLAWGKDVGTEETLSVYKKEKTDCIWYLNNMVQKFKGDSTVEIRSQIVSYHSPVDSSRQEYLIQFPKNFNPQIKVPLIVHFPPRVETPKMLSQSYLPASDEVDNMFSLLTDGYNVIDVWSFGANYSGRLFPAGVKEYNTMVNEIINTYCIDTSRIYIMASCSGTLKAIQYAAYSSIPIAAMAFCPAYYETEDLKNAQQLMYNVRDIPLFAINSLKDEVTPIKGLDMLIDSISLFDNHLTYEKVNNVGRDFMVEGMQEKLLQNLMKQTSLNSNKNFSFKTSYVYNGEKYWFKIDEIKKDSEAIVSANALKKDSVILSTENIISFTINLDLLPHDISEKFVLQLNGEDSIITKTKGELTFIEEHSKRESSYQYGPINNFFANDFICYINSSDPVKKSYLKESLAKSYYRNFQRKLIFHEKEDCTDEKNRNILFVNDSEFGNIPEHLTNSKYLNLKENRLIVCNKVFPKYNNSAFVVHYPLDTENKSILLIDISNLDERIDKIWRSIFNNQYDFFQFDFSSERVTFLQEAYF